MKTTVCYLNNYHLKEDVRTFFNNNYAVYVKGVYYPTMCYSIADDFDNGYRVEFTADNKDTALILEAITRLNKSVYTAEI